jgi:hypothetical protein
MKASRFGRRPYSSIEASFAKINDVQHANLGKPMNFLGNFFSQIGGRLIARY